MSKEIDTKKIDILAGYLQTYKLEHIKIGDIEIKRESKALAQMEHDLEIKVKEVMGRATRHG